MGESFLRSGPLMALESYPQWAQELVLDSAAARWAVSEHVFYQHMRDGQLTAASLRPYMVGGWPVVEQFPLYMAQNLLKTRFGRSPGEDMARRWLMRNIRVELNHADQWLEWAEAYGIGLDDLHAQAVPAELQALGHWCWQSCVRDDLALAMAATNYAIEGATGEWSALVCSGDAYQASLPVEQRKSAMRWLRSHAQYDDEHPWQALEIICTLCGTQIDAQRWRALREAIGTSYAYMQLFLDRCLALEQAASRRRVQASV